MDRSISPETVSQLAQDFSASRANRIARNAVTSSDVLKAARNPTTMRTYVDTFGVSRARAGAVTNQRQSGRCWMFATFNVVRAKTMELLDVDTFEFSQVFGMFYDKLEKANSFLGHVIDTATLPADDRVVAGLMERPIGDGGQFRYASNLIEKWGLVPKYAMPETACSRNSSQMNRQLERLLRRDAARIRAAAAAGAGPDELEALREEMLAGIHRMLSICLGEPPATFDLVCGVGKNAKVDPAKVFEVLPEDQEDETGDEAPVASDDVVANVDANAGTNPIGVDAKGRKGADAPAKAPRRIVRDLGITPREFVERYVGFAADDYVDLVSVEGAAHPLGHLYGCRQFDTVAGGDRWRVLNVEMDVIERAAVASLEAGVPCYMACDVMQQFGRSLEDFPGILALDTIDAEGLFDVDLSMTREEMFDLQEASFTHAMTFQGVQLDEDGRPLAWRVENSWGKDSCKDGYLTMSGDWYRLYGGGLMVERRFLDEETLRAWDELPIEDVEPWTCLGRAAGPQD